MEIYILREGKEIGPLSEEAVQTLLKHGNVLVTDLAWYPGMPQWVPLMNVLYPAATPLSQTPPPPPLSYGSAPALEPAPVVVSEPATAKQKAYLAYLGSHFDPDLTKEGAAVLLNDAIENPELQARVAKWNEDRLRLHPELFAAEIRARKENRSRHYCEVCQIEGAEVFTNVTKAHCQVLVQYLDVRFPNWDANEREAVWNYFFPAMAEKFPQVVNKRWRGKLKYPGGRKVAPELSRRGAVTPGVKRKLPTAALVRGLAGGLLILALVYAGTKARQLGYFDRLKIPASDPSAPPKTQDPGGNLAAPKSPVPANPPETAPPPSDDPVKPPPPIADGNPAPPAPPPDPGMPAKAPDTPTPGMAAVPGMPGASERLFNPPPSVEPSNPGPPVATPAPIPEIVPTAKLFVKLTKPVDVPLPFGRITLPAGTPVKLVGREGVNLRVRHMESDVLVPAASTDFAESPFPFSPPGPAPVGPAPPPPEPPAPVPAPKPPTESLF